MYEWDDEKNKINLIKHGISFEDAQKFIFEGRNIILLNVAYQNGEVRHAIIGKFENKFFTGIFTYRNYNIRIISVRRSREKEKKQAEEKGF